jgi:hypothetical protein
MLVRRPMEADVLFDGFKLIIHVRAAASDVLSTTVL